MHIQFKGLLMGWYHVNRIGKGICLGNVDEVHYNEDFIAKHTPTKDEALELKLRDIRDEELDGYETWPLYKKWMAITQDAWSFHREVNDAGCCADESSQIYSDALHYIFEKCYGYDILGKPNQLMREFVEEETDKIPKFCITWVADSIMLKFKKQWLDKYYPGKITDLVGTSSPERKMKTMQIIASAYGVPTNEVLFVDDKYDTVAQAIKYGFCGMTTVEVMTKMYEKYGEKH